jgi:hypothetical protein
VALSECGELIAETSTLSMDVMLKDYKQYKDYKVFTEKIGYSEPIGFLELVTDTLHEKIMELSA